MTIFLFKIVLYVFQAPVVQKVDSSIHRINHYPVENTIGFVNAYSLDSDLSGGGARRRVVCPYSPLNILQRQALSQGMRLENFRRKSTKFVHRFPFQLALDTNLLTF